MRILLVDNYDSFTYNLAQAFLTLGAAVEVWRNDQFTLPQAEALKPDRIVISPGPGRPEAAGLSVDIIRAFAGRVPILGVCLGHQAVVVAFGGEVRAAARLMHGKTSTVFHDRRGVFAGVPQPFEAGRYHSLAVSRDGLPEDLEVSARADDGEVMGVRHRSAAIEGVQFHPESILTPCGVGLLENFLGDAGRVEREVV